MAITSRVGWRTSYRRAPTLAPVPMPSGTVEPANICPMACLPIRPQGEGVAHPLWPRKWRQALRLNEGACPYRWQRVHVYTRSHRAGAKSKMVFAHHSNSPNSDQPKPFRPPMQTARCMVLRRQLRQEVQLRPVPASLPSKREVGGGWVEIHLLKGETWAPASGSCTVLVASGCVPSGNSSQTRSQPQTPPWLARWCQSLHPRICCRGCVQV